MLGAIKVNVNAAFVKRDRRGFMSSTLRCTCRNCISLCKPQFVLCYEWL